MVRIDEIAADSLLADSQVACGDRLKAINGVPMRDLLDVRFAAAEEDLDLEFVRPDDTDYSVHIEKHPDEDLGVVFEPMKIRSCNNKCDFCFVFQQPKKVMRRELYIMDDDYRYSFLYGNFVTLTNIDEGDVSRIIEQRLSPLYISVHCTDDKVRKDFLRSPNAWPIVPLMKRFADAGIRMHAQVVVVPGFNDGEILERTIQDLAQLYPAVESLGVVPVGLTRYRQHLPDVNPVSQAYAAEMVSYLDRHSDSFRKSLGVGFVYTADEFYVLADADFPAESYYDDFPQLENGVGMGRQALDHFAQSYASLPRKLDRPQTIHWVTGRSAATFLIPQVIDKLNAIDGLTIEPVVVTNEFFGDTVSVSGLLTGRDILEHLMARKPTGGFVYLPPNCLNTDGLFLDDMTPAMISLELGLPVHQAEYEFVPGLRDLLVSGPDAERSVA